MRGLLGFFLVLLLIIPPVWAGEIEKGQIVILNSYPGDRTFLYRSPEAFWRCKREIQEYGKAGMECLKALLTWTNNGEKAIVLEDESSYSGMVRVEILTGPEAGYRGWVMSPFVEPAE